MKKANLMLHCGAHAVTRDDLAAVATPGATRSWQPIAHTKLLATVEQQLTESKLQVIEQAHGVTKNGARYFGLLQVAATDSVDGEAALIVGIRNSHDKAFPAGLCAGNQVFVCDNLAFSGEIKVARKHTSFILHDLPTLIHNAIHALTGVWSRQEERIAKYKTINIADSSVHDLTIRALDANVFCGERIKPILQEWREPTHEAFKPRNLWSFFNAVTGHLHGNLQLLPKRTQALYGVCDEFATR